MVFFIHYAAAYNILFCIGVKNHVYVTATHAAVSLKDFRLPSYNNDALLKKIEENRREKSQHPSLTDTKTLHQWPPPNALYIERGCAHARTYYYIYYGSCRYYIGLSNSVWRKLWNLRDDRPIIYVTHYFEDPVYYVWVSSDVWAGASTGMVCGRVWQFFFKDAHITLRQVRVPSGKQSIARMTFLNNNNNDSYQS